MGRVSFHMIRYNNHPLPYGLEYIDDWTVRKTATCTGEDTLQYMEALCHHLIARPDPMVVPVYSFKYLGKQINVHRYQYDMMRLGDLTREETAIVYQVGDAWRSLQRHIATDPTHQFKDNAIYTPDECWDKHPKLMSFLQEVVELDRYHDLHGENVMVDNDGDYRVIDVEGFLNTPLSRPSNAWILPSCQTQLDTDSRLVV